MTTNEEKQLLDDVAQIKRGLFGESNLDQPGLVHDVTELKKWRSEVKLKSAFLTGVGVAAAFIFERAWEWLTGGHK